MVWFKVDDRFYSHPKVLAAGAAAIGLWTMAGTWSSGNEKDGFVPDHVLPRLDADGPSLAQRLAAAGLWTRTRGGYLFHDWADYQPNSDSVVRKRKAARERMRTLRENRRSEPTIAGQGKDRSREHPANVRSTFAERSPHVRNPVPVPVPEGSSDEEPSPPPRRRPPDGGPEFEEFYAAYPKHVGRKAAVEKWAKALKDGADPAAIIAGAKRYADERRDENPQYTKHPATWLNQACWEDDPQSPARRFASSHDEQIAAFLRGSDAPGQPEPPRRALPPGRDP